MPRFIFSGWQWWRRLRSQALVNRQPVTENWATMAGHTLGRPHKKLATEVASRQGCNHDLDLTMPVRVEPGGTSSHPRPSVPHLLLHCTHLHLQAAPSPASTTGRLRFCSVNIAAPPHAVPTWGAPSLHLELLVQHARFGQLGRRQTIAGMPR